MLYLGRKVIGDDGFMLLLGGNGGYLAIKIVSRTVLGGLSYHTTVVLGCHAQFAIILCFPDAVDAIALRGIETQALLVEWCRERWHTVP